MHPLAECDTGSYANQSPEARLSSSNYVYVPPSVGIDTVGISVGKSYNGKGNNTIGTFFTLFIFTNKSIVICSRRAGDQGQATH